MIKYDENGNRIKMIGCTYGCGDTFPESHFRENLIEKPKGSIGGIYRTEYICKTCGGRGEEEPSHFDTGLCEDLYTVGDEVKRLEQQLAQAKWQLSILVEKYNEDWNTDLEVKDF